MSRVAWLLALLAACGSLDGEDPYALWRVHEHPAGAFHFHYPAPPFESATGSAAVHPVLEIAPEGGGGDPWPRYRLEARLTAHDSLDDAAVEETAALAAAGFAPSPPEAAWNRAGDRGLEIRGGRNGAEAVVLLLPGAAGVAVMSLAGTGDMEHPDVDLLLDGFEPRAAGGH